MKYHGVLTNPQDKEEIAQTKPQKRTNCNTLRSVESWARAVLANLDETAYVEIFEMVPTVVKRIYKVPSKE